MPVVALTQGMGSLAQDIAEQLAQELKLSTLQHEVTEHVAQKMHVPKSLISRLRTGKAGAIERLRTDFHAMAVYTAEEVLEAAAKGNVVIRGWGATQILRAVPHVPCIRVMRPFDKRVEWLMKELDTDDRDLAEKEIHRSDHANATRMHDQFGVHWGDPVLFDMVLNTDRLSVQTCVEQIKALLKRPEFAETEASRTLLHGMALSAHVRAALSAHADTQAVNITIESVDGSVVLSGIVADDAEKNAAQRVAAGVTGVKAVDNRLHAITDAKHFPTNRR
ncbi:MAG: cytidylate kinase family protein [Aquincola sp.]|nr:cytidylate kinase family protein [Aquincola sp.]MDH4289143.1 cytidylate kinase family protein [Aquincola sp.]MDH5331971.1 cytidylate kinase family protein [Aquincola sp.]